MKSNLLQYKDLQVIVYEKSPDINDQDMLKGYVVHKLEVYFQNNLLGYLKISYVPKQNAKEKFPTVAHFLVEHSGWFLDLDNKNKLWKNLYLYSNFRSDYYKKFGYQLTEEDMDNIPEQIRDEEINKILKYYKKNLDDFLKDSKTPFIDYSFIEKEYRRMGLGTLLYCSGAKWIYEQTSMLLRASGLQSYDAKKIWNNFRNNGISNTEVLSHKEKKFAIDGNQITNDFLLELSKKIYNKLGEINENKK